MTGCARSLPESPKTPDPLRLLFVGTGDIALPAFRWLLRHGPKPLALVTQPDKPVGRHQILSPPKIKEEALAAGIHVLQPEKSGDAITELAQLQPEIIVVMAYGQILREPFLHLAKTAIINLHASLLPAYRGSSCIQAAIARSDAETGVTAMHVVRELDAGDIIHAKRIPIFASDTGGILHDRLADLAAEVLAETLPMIASGTAPRKTQDPEKVSVVTKLLREHGKIDWTRNGTEIECLVRAYDPWPGTYATFQEGNSDKRLKIFPPIFLCNEDLSPGEVSSAGGKLRVGCNGGSVEITMVQPEGGRRMSAADFLKARSPQRLG